MTPGEFLLLVLAWLLLAATLLMLVFRAVITKAVLEPVLRHPVFIIESDDWGFGPLEQAERLKALATLLARFRNGSGRCPVMTLGVVLAGPDTARIAANGCREYVRTGLSNSDLAIVRDAMFEGTAKGVFALQLHGLEHFWPPSLMKVATSNEFAARWLTGPALPQTEDLPAHLQSRWIDASALPSQALSPDDIAAAVHQEIQAFSETFGHPAEVVVPPTFVWNMEVEHAWIRHGIRCVVTPGCRYEHRGVDGKLVRGQPLFHNGERGPDGLRYVVRNDYFEPQLGHSSADALLSVDRSTRLGRPTLFETHRFNFLGMNGEAAMRELESLVRHVLEKYPEVVFLSTRELAACYATSSDLLETRLARRLHCIIERLREQSRLYKLAWLTGIVLPAWMLWRFTAVRQT